MLDYRFYTFLTLSKTLNYTKAAQQLCITQPAVSQHIKYLEHEYHCKLFAHDGKDLRLTHQGVILQRSITTMAADEQHTRQLIEAAEHEHVESLHFGATLTIGEFILPQKLGQYMQAFPDTRLTMIVENTTTLIQLLKAGKIQFAFVEGYFKKSDVYHEPLSLQRYVAVKHKDYQLKQPTTSIEDLLQETLIVREAGSGTREILERVLKEKNLSLFDFTHQIEIGNINAIKQLTAQKLGITFLYEAAIQKELEHGTLEIIPLQGFPIEREFSFICLKNSGYFSEYRTFFKQIQSS